MPSDHEALTAANQRFYRAFEKRDLEAMGQIWSQGTGSLCIHPGRPALQGWPTIRDSWQQIFRHTAYLEIEVEVTAIEVVGDLGYVVVVEQVTQINGRRRIQAESTATNLFERLGQNWFLVHHHGAPLAPRR